MSTAALSPVPTPDPTRRSAEFEADLDRLRETMVTWPETYVVGRLTRAVQRIPLGRPMTAVQRVMGAAVAIALRLLVPVVVTTATASWAGAPVWTWFGIALFHGAMEASWGVAVADPFLEKQVVALPAALERAADLRRLIDFTNQRWRARFYAPAAVAIALLILAAAALVAPDSLRAVHPGSLGLIALVLYEFGEERAMRFLYFRLYRDESRYPHRLSWLSPADSPAVQGLLSLWRKLTVINAVGLTMDFIFVVLLLAPDSVSALLAPIVGFALAAVVFDTVAILTVRTSVQRIVQHTRGSALESLRQRIEGLEPRTRELTTAESEELRALLATYAAVRESSTGPSGSETLGHALSALAIPALAFFLAVMAEVYAERLLDQFLP
jgi:hypothetical protein